jgi:haloacetate dehalogenase
LSASDAAAKYWHWIFHLVPDLPERLIEGREEVYLDFIFNRAPGLLDLLRSDGSWDEYVHIWKQPGAVEAALNDYRATYSVDLPRFREENAAGRRLTAPTLLLWGERGNLAGLPVLDIWKQVATNVSGFEMKGCGHYLPEEQPSQIIQYLLAFSTDSFKAD